MPKEVERLIGEAREGRIGRREFIGQVATLLGSAALATVLFDVVKADVRRVDREYSLLRKDSRGS